MIKDAPTKVIDDVGQEYDPTDVVGYMENTYPEMTSDMDERLEIAGYLEFFDIIALILGFVLVTTIDLEKF